MRDIHEERVHEPEGLLVVPAGEVRCAVLVLSGSSGRVEGDRARLLARHGAAAMAMRWFGGAGQPPGICEIALESFGPSLSALHQVHPRLVVLGTSKGAEVALLLAADDARIRVTVALSPSSVVWGNLGPGRDGRDRPSRSCWTKGGTPLPFVPYDDAWQPAETAGRPAWRGLYEQSLHTYAEETAAAAIRVEDITGQVILSAGGDDQVWPSALFARQIQERRHGQTTLVLSHPAAGHRQTLPGESQASGGTAMARGGNPSADRAAGVQVWTALRSAGLVD